MRNDDTRTVTRRALTLHQCTPPGLADSDWPMRPSRRLLSRRLLSPTRTHGVVTHRGGVGASTDGLLREASIRGIRTTRGKVTLLSNDCEPFVVSTEVAHMLEVLKTFEAGDHELVPLVEMDSHTLERVLSYCTFHAQSSSIRTTESDTDAFDDAFLETLGTSDLLFQLIKASNFLNIPGLTKCLSKKVAFMMVAEWADVDAVKSAFVVHDDFTDDEHAFATHDERTFGGDLLLSASKLEAEYVRKPSTDAAWNKPTAQAEIERLLLLEHFYTAWMARLRHFHHPSTPQPESRLALELLHVPSVVWSDIYNHFVHPSPQMLETLRARRTHLVRLQRELEQAERMTAISQQHVPNEPFRVSYDNGRNKGPSRMYDHGADPESDEEEYDETLRPYIRWMDTTCGDETCGDIIRDISQDEDRYAIYADWTGHIGRDNSRHRVRYLDEGETHDDAKHDMCRKKGCSRCDIASNRCISNHHDMKSVIRLKHEIWMELQKMDWDWVERTR
jgi:hypothetical protein